MDRKSTVFFYVFFTLIAGTVFATYLRYFVSKDYYVAAQAECDPSKEACFVHVCDVEIDGECPTDESELTTYYKNVRKKANLIPLCDPADENCHALDCVTGMDCEVTYCDEETVPEGDTCNDPDRYSAESAAAEAGGSGADPADTGSGDTSEGSMSGTDDSTVSD